MIDSDIRALVVKTLTDQQVTRMHLWEQQHRTAMTPSVMVPTWGGL